MRHRLSDEQWRVIEDLFPKPAPTGRPPADPRKMLEAMLWLNNTGAKWRDLPRELGAWPTVFRYFDHWNNNGLLAKIVTRLTHWAESNDHLAGDLWCLDGTILRAHRCAAGGAKKRTQRSRATTL